jgi:ribose transport system ATP-binding protein
MGAAVEEDLVLKLSKVSKSFGAIQALRAVDFELRKGEIHAIAGENGAGKSTLMNIVDGIIRPDSGQIFFQGELVEIASPAMAQRLGIGLVHQEIALCPDVSVAENIFMGATSINRSVLMDYKGIEAKAKAVLS